jgi:hypothetical protein
MKRLRLLLVIFLVFPLWKTKAQEFTAEGEVVYKIFYGLGGTVSFQLHKHFLIKRNGDQWFIQTSSLTNKYKDEQADVYFYREAGCDGTNIFWLSKNDINPSTNQTIQADDQKPVDVEATITAGIAPNFNYNLIAPVWLAYASKPYFDKVKDGKVKHADYVSDEVFFNETVPAEWQISPEAPEFIHSITYHHDGMTLKRTVDGEEKVAYPKPYDHGFVGARFISGEYTNVDGFSIPMQFKLAIIIPSTESTNGFKVAASVEGRLTRFSKQVDIESFYPEIVGKALVTDNRFLNKGMKDFAYVAKQGEPWLQVGDTNLDKFVNYYERYYAKKLGAKPVLTVSTKRFIMIPFIILNAAFFVWLLLRLRRRNN